VNLRSILVKARLEGFKYGVLDAIDNLLLGDRPEMDTTLRQSDENECWSNRA